MPWHAPDERAASALLRQAHRNLSEADIRHFIGSPAREEFPLASPPPRLASPLPAHRNLSETGIRHFIGSPAREEPLASPPPRLASPLPRGENGGVAGGGLDERVARLEQCLETELQSVQRLCKACLRATEEGRASEPPRRASVPDEVWDTLHTLQADVRTHGSRLQHCVTVDDLPDFLRERDRLTLQQYVDQRFEESLSQVRAAEGKAQHARRALEQRCHAVEQSVAQLQARGTEALIKADEMKADMKSWLDVVEVRMRQETGERLARLGKDADARTKDLLKEFRIDADADGQRLRGGVQELRAELGALAERVESASRQAKAALEHGCAAERTASEAEQAAQRAERFYAGAAHDNTLDACRELVTATRMELRAESRAELQKLVEGHAELRLKLGGLSSQSERAAEEARRAGERASQAQEAAADAAEAAAAAASASATKEEVQSEFGALRRRVDEASQASSERSRALEREVEKVAKAAETAGHGCQQASSTAADAGAAAHQASGRLAVLERRADAADEALAQRAHDLAVGLRGEVRGGAEAAQAALQREAEALRESLASLRAAQQVGVEELRTGLASLSERVASAAAGAVEARALAQRLQEALRGEAREEVLRACGELVAASEAAARTELRALAEGDAELRREGEALRARAEELGIGLRRAAEAAELAQRRGEASAAEAAAATASAEALGARVADLAAAAQRASEEARGATAASADAAAVAAAARAAWEDPATLRKLTFDLEAETREHREALERHVECELLDAREAAGQQLTALASQVGRAVEECRAERAAAQVAVEVGLSAQRQADQLEWLDALEGQRDEINSQRAELTELAAKFTVQHGRFSEVEADTRRHLTSLRTLSDKVAALDTQLKSRLQLWSGESKELREHVDDIRGTADRALQGCATIQNALSALHMLADDIGGTPSFEEGA